MEKLIGKKRKCGERNSFVATTQKRTLVTLRNNKNT
jgi:hypothetical protein